MPRYDMNYEVVYVYAIINNKRHFQNTYWWNGMFSIDWLKPGQIAKNKTVITMDNNKM